MPLILPTGPTRQTILLGSETARGSIGVIVRMLQGRVKAECVGLFREKAARALELTRSRRACSFASVGRQSNKDGSEEIVFLSVWNELADVYDWVGGIDLLCEPMIAGDRPEVFAYYDIQHYEVVETSTEGEPASAALPMLES
jgi:hypothetical protein